MKKRLLALTLAAAMTASLTACGGAKTAETTKAELAATEKPAETASGDATAAADTTTAGSEDPFAALGEFTMTISHSQPAGNPRTVSLDHFAEKVEEQTYGHVKVDVYGDSQLGTEKETLEQVVGGTIQGMRGGPFDFTPKLLIFSLPFLTNSREEISALLHSEFAQKVADECAKESTKSGGGFYIIDLCDAGGYRQFSSGSKPIKTPADLKGQKIRTNGLKTIDLTFQALGATTVTIPYGDLYMNLKNGTADGQDNPWVNVEGMKFYEVQKYFTESNYLFMADPFYVNAAWWDSLPSEFQEIIQKCATEAGEENDQLCDTNAKTALETIKAAGCEVYTPTEEEMNQFKEAAQSVYDAIVSEGLLTEDELKEMQDIVAAAK